MITQEDIDAMKDDRMDTEALRTLVRKLRNEWPVGPGNRVACGIMSEAADAIEHLEAELAAARSFIFNTGREMAKMEAQLAAEKALADRLAASYAIILNDKSKVKASHSLTAYRKARGL